MTLLKCFLDVSSHLNSSNFHVVHRLSLGWSVGPSVGNAFVEVCEILLPPCSFESPLVRL